MKFKLILALLTTSINTYAFITVGDELNGCDYSSLGTAILEANNIGEQEIRITRDFTQAYNDVINQSLIFKGGYENCNDAINDAQRFNKTNWTANNANTTVINITDNSNTIESFNLTIDGFNIYGGNNQNNLEAGGISIKRNTNTNDGSIIYILNSNIYDNTGHRGGGIAVSGGSSVLVEIQNTDIHDNTSLTQGGGISCVQKVVVQLINHSSVHHNTAENGGGVGINDCTFWLATGDNLPAGQIQEGIYNNTASIYGGGIDAGFSDLFFVGTTQHPASVSNNSSLWQGPGAKNTGGGIHLNFSNLTASNARIDSNTTTGWSAGIFAEFQSHIIMSRLPGKCWGDNTQCSSLSQNKSIGTSKISAGLTLFNKSTAEIDKTIIDSNEADFATAFSVGKSSSLSVTNSIVSNNSPSNGQQALNLIYSTEGSTDGNSINFSYNTIVDNNAEYVFYLFNSTNTPINLNLYNSLIIQPNSSIIFHDSPSSHISMDCDIINHVFGESFSDYNVGQVSFENPMFVDRANKNYHLTNSSPAIDYCDNFLLPSDNDLNMRLRGVDNPDSQNFLGLYDLGAYEFFTDNIFVNGFE